MVDALINLLILAVAMKIAYDEGHFRGRRMVRDEWIRSLHTKEAGMSKGKVTKEEYNALLQKNLGRVNTSRDEAVRATNEALGYGSSTALQFDVPDTEQPTAQPKGAA